MAKYKKGTIVTLDSLELKLEQKLGRKYVWKARVAGSERFVVAKFFPNEPDQEEYFTRESSSLRRVNENGGHPNVVRVEAIQNGENKCVVLEYVPGVDFYNLFCRLRRRQKGFHPLEIQLFREVLDALQHGSEKGVVHNDMKDDCVIVYSRDGSRMTVDLLKNPYILNVKLCDYGFGRNPDTIALDDNLQRNAQILETPGHSPPEKLYNFGDQDVRVDIFSAGVTLYYLLTGNFPYGNDDNRSINQRQSDAAARGNIPDPSQINREVRPALAQVVKKAIHPDRKERFSTPAEMKEAFDKAYKDNKYTL
ncbi:hypothetical protein COV18_06240 [Candidatus Woesearchaeota archaeon CG10_big_fil_rev_8_21_14_0_10_37_12]|nr:MAG: hypothetical protein COV18_06240 [Candidatus Woesearchaeota archaeon CG10_big_fil_rev_8_21_14_0_10_37_12]